MNTLSIFVASLVLIVLSLAIKSLEIRKGRKIFLGRLFQKTDRIIFRIISKLEYFISQINLPNTWLIFKKIIANIRALVTVIKRRFDHKHSPFFVKRDQSIKSRGSVSFFLKNVSDYKKSLREDEDRSSTS